MVLLTDKRLPRVPVVSCAMSDDERPNRPSLHVRTSRRAMAVPMAPTEPIPINRTPPGLASLGSATVDGSTSNEMIKGSAGRRLQLERDAYERSPRSRPYNAQSLVDHMLSSFPGQLDLDRLPPKRRSMNTRSQTVDELRLYGYLREDEPGSTSVASRFSLKRPARPRGHTYSTSSSSDHDLRPADRLSRHSRRLSRDRRSNSGSNFQLVLERVDSLRHGDKEHKERGRFFEAQRALPPSPHAHAHAHVRQWSGRTGRSGKNSTTSSFDAGYVHVYGSTRWATTFGARSASIDHDYGDRNLRSAPYEPRRSNFFAADALPPSMNDDDDLDDLDAAPTPVVYAGPSRQHSPVRSGVPGSSAGPRRRGPDQGVGRKISVWASRDSFQHDAMSDSEPSAVVRDHVGAGRKGSKPKRLPALPGQDDTSAPGPTVSFGKAGPPDRSESTPRAKERVGFFRRVFGYSKNQVLSNNGGGGGGGGDDAASQSRAVADDRRHGSTTDDHRRGIRPTMLPPDTIEPDKDLPPSPPAPVPPPVLHKKSSFFWRRKRSLSDSRAPPVLLHPPMDPLAGLAAPGRPLSPVSSLRKVMDPYIRAPPPSRGRFGESLEHLDHGGHDDDERFWRQRVTAREAILDELDGPLPNRAGATGRPDVRMGNPWAEQDRVPRFGSPRRVSPAPRSRTMPVEMRDDAPVAVVMDAIGSGNGVGGGEATASSLEPTEMPPAVTSDVSTSSRAASSKPVQSRPSSAGKNHPITKDNAEEHEAGEAPTGHADGWISATVDRETTPVTPTIPRSTKSTRIWLEPSSSEEHLPKEAGFEDVEEASPAPVSPARRSVPAATSEVQPTVLDVSLRDDQKDVEADRTFLISSSTDVLDALEPTMDDYGRAKELFDGTATFLGNQTTAAWLGELGDARTRTRKAYTELFNWTNVTILTAMRELCSKLVLKAETQQVDRILDAVSGRWCDCNPSHGFKATDVVHTICYSILLLNTDLYLADIEQKMTRNQFIKNTMPTIRRVAEDTAPDAFEPANALMQPRSRNSSINPDLPIVKLFSEMRFRESDELRPAPDLDRPTRKLSRRRAVTDELRGRSPTPLGSDSCGDEGGILVKVPFYGTKKAWEAQIELVLKDIYSSIRRQQLPLCTSGVPGAELDALQPGASNTLSVLTGNVLKRSPSTLSKAQSENYAPRGRPDLQRVGSTGRWGSKTRSRPRLYPTSTIGSSRTSFEDQSIWTPTNPNSWSRQSLSRTQTSMSANSSRSHAPPGAYRQSIGFANALSQAIIRDDSASIDERVGQLLEDETLGLAGAPWVKEGIVQHKHHLDSMDKKCKDRNWNECFAVVSNGYMRLFSFASKSGSLRARGKPVPAGAVVGGGNWTENADAVGSFLLRQTIASTLPAPGYSKTRPYVWALSFPTGAVHLFQVGTPEIVAEFVSTANYWSARLSKEPVFGGISNIEYGWGEAVIDPALVGTEEMPPPPSSSSGARASLQGSIRSSFDHTAGPCVRPRLAGDKVVISEWSPPQQSMVASRLGEAEQLQALMTYVKNIETELQRHNELRSAMLLAFTPRHSNTAKAMANWEKKSSYLLREIVKFRTYIDSLTSARAQAELLHRTQQQAQAQQDREREREQPEREPPKTEGLQVNMEAATAEDMQAREDGRAENKAGDGDGEDEEEEEGMIEVDDTLEGIYTKDEKESN